MTRHSVRHPFSLTIFLLFIACRLSYCQNLEVRFESISKLKTGALGKGYVYDGHQIIVCIDKTNSMHLNKFRTYQVYSFKVNTWENLNFPIKVGTRNLSSSISEFLPGRNVMVTMGNPIEFLDVENLRLNSVKIEGGYFPLSCGSAVWKDKIYFFGGVWVSNINANTKFNLRGTVWWTTDRVFSFDSTRFTELTPMPEQRDILGKFVGDYLYALGGSKAGINYNDIYKYDPVADEWSEYGHLPHEVAENSIATDGVYIYITGTINDHGYLGIYDPKANAYCEYKTNLNYKGGALVVHQQNIYFFAGRLPEDTRIVENKLYKLNLNTIPPAEWISCQDN